MALDCVPNANQGQVNVDSQMHKAAGTEGKRAEMRRVDALDEVLIQRPEIKKIIIMEINTDL